MTDFGPKNLADAIGSEGHACGLPLSHDRINECHHWWHVMAQNYHEPDEFRWSLGAFLQAARSASLMIQVEKAAFEDMAWYDAWVEEVAKKSEVIRWVNSARVQVVHKGTLAPASWVELRCLFPKGDHRAEDSDDEGPAAFTMNPFICTHALMHASDWLVGDEDHGHDMVRHWEVEELPDREILDVCAEVFGELDLLLKVAHEQIGQGMQMTKAGEPIDRPSGRMPCMDDLEPHLIAHFEPRSGRSQEWTNEPPGLHSS